MQWAHGPIPAEAGRWGGGRGGQGWLMGIWVWEAGTEKSGSLAEGAVPVGQGRVGDHGAPRADTWDFPSEPSGDNACAQMGSNRGVSSTATGLEHRLSLVPFEALIPSAMGEAAPSRPLPRETRRGTPFLLPGLWHRGRG